MRILIASDYYYPYLPGGGERRMFEIARRLAKKHEVHVVTRRFGGLLAEEEHEGVHIHRVSVVSGRPTLESVSDGLTFMIKNLIRGLSIKFDVCAPQQFFPLPPCWLLSRMKRVPIVPTIHDVYRETWLQKYGKKGILMSVFENLTLKMDYERIVTVSQTTKKKLVRAGVPPDKIAVIPNGVDVQSFQKVLAKKCTRPRIVYIGRLVRYKHVDHLLHAFSRLSTDSELLIVGDGPEKPYLQALAKKLGIQERVRFEGFVPEQKKIKLLKSSHVLVLPSSTEGFGIVVLEAWASQTVPVVSDIPALKELVQDGKTGLLFRLGDVEELSRKIGRALEDPMLRRRITKKAFKLVQDKFSWDGVASQMDALLRSVSAS